MDTVDTLSKEKNTKKITKVLNRVWDVFKGLIIAVAAVTLIFDTVVLYMLYSYVEAEYSKVEHDVPYYMQTQDYLDLVEMYEKDPDSAEYKAMLKAFNTKYSVPYKGNQTYIELAKAHKENPDSEEYHRLLEKFLEEYDIPVEDISFDD